jgi:hypothetical protein
MTIIYDTEQTDIFHQPYRLGELILIDDLTPEINAPAVLTKIGKIKGGNIPKEDSLVFQFRDSQGELDYFTLFPLTNTIGIYKSQDSKPITIQFKPSPQKEPMFRGYANAIAVGREPILRYLESLGKDFEIYAQKIKADELKSNRNLFERTLLNLGLEKLLGPEIKFK